MGVLFLVFSRRPVWGKGTNIIMTLRHRIVRRKREIKEGKEEKKGISLHYYYRGSVVISQDRKRKIILTDRYKGLIYWGHATTMEPPYNIIARYFNTLGKRIENLFETSCYTKKNKNRLCSKCLWRGLAGFG